MSITMNELLQVEELHLKLMESGTEPDLSRHITWVHPTETLDANWSEPGEVLLTTGAVIPLEALDSEEDNALLLRGLKALAAPNAHSNKRGRYRYLLFTWLRRLKQAGVIAVGFGLGIKHDSVPKELKSAAHKVGLSLFEIPLATSFTGIAKIVYRSFEVEHGSMMRRASIAQRQLLQTVGQPHVMRTVIRKVASMINGWAAYVDSKGRVQEISHGGDRKLASSWALRLLQNSSPDSDKNLFAFSQGRDFCVSAVYDSSATPSATSPSPCLGAVVASIPEPDQSDIELRSTTIAAADLFSSLLPGIFAQEERTVALRNTMLDSIALDGGSKILSALPHLWSRVPTPPFAVVILHADEEVLRRLYRRMDSSPKRAGIAESALFSVTESKLRIVVPKRDLDQLLRSIPYKDECALGSSLATSWEDLPLAFLEAQQKMQREILSTLSPDISKISPQGLMDPQMATAFSEEFLRPVMDLDPIESHQLIETLKVLLETSFAVSASAQKMGVHRHTIEKRITRIERELGIDLSTQSSRVKVWIALKFF